MDNEEADAASELVLSRFEWKDGSWVTFIDPESLSRNDIKKLRTAFGSTDNQVESGHIGLDEALALLIDDWEIVSKPDLRVPKYDKKALGYLPGLMSMRLEDHIRPVLEALKPKKDSEDEGEHGSPRRPARG